MRTLPTLKTIVQVIEGLPLAKRRKAPQGRKPLYSDNYIVALAVYQKQFGFKYAQQMLVVLKSLDIDVPAPSTFCTRKQQLLGQIILVVKHLCAQQQAQAIKQHLDSKKVEVIDFARANRTKLAGTYGYDHIHKSTFFGFRLPARVNA